MSFLNPLLLREQTNEFTSLTKPPDIADQIGYSSANKSNDLMELRKSLQNENRTVCPATSSNMSTLQTNVKDRYCFLVAQLPPNEIAVDLVRVYFSEADWFFLVLDQYQFENLHTSWIAASEGVLKQGNIQHLLRNLQYFPALLFQVLALALQFLPQNNTSAQLALRLETLLECDLLSEKYSMLGLHLMALLGRHDPTTTSVQHDLMRAVWLKNCGRGTESWHSIGSAIRQAQELGLHLESKVVQGPGDSVEDTLVRLWDDECKRRLWASLFVFDSHMALILGRPRTINRDDCSAKPPIDCNIPRDPSKLVPMAATAYGDQEPSSYTPQIFHYEIAHKIHEILSSVKDYYKVDVLHNQVISLLDGLPPAMRPQNPDTSWDSRNPHFPKSRKHIASVASSFLMALHRPHVAVHARSRQAAVRAALDTLHAQQNLFELMSEHHYKVYGFSFYTIDAGIFLSAVTIGQAPENNDSDLLEQALYAIQQAFSRLSLLKKRSAVAVSGEQLLRQCYEKLQEHIQWRPVPPNPLCLCELPELVAGQSFSFAQEGFNAAQNKNLPNNIFDAGCTQGQEVQSNNMDIFDFDYDFNASFLLDSGAGVPGYDMNQLSNSFSWNPSLG